MSDEEEDSDEEGAFQDIEEFGSSSRKPQPRKGGAKAAAAGDDDDDDDDQVSVSSASDWQRGVEAGRRQWAVREDSWLEVEAQQASAQYWGGANEGSEAGAGGG